MARDLAEFTVDEMNRIGEAAGRRVRAEHFRQGLPVVVEIDGVPLYEYPDGTFKTVREVRAEENRAAGERKAG